MSIQNTTPSHQQRQHWSSEQALAWSGLPVVTIRRIDAEHGELARIALGQGEQARGGGDQAPPPPSPHLQVVGTPANCQDSPHPLIYAEARQPRPDRGCTLELEGEVRLGARS